MGKELRRIKSRKKALERLDDLGKRSETVLVIHYSCESFYDTTEGQTPRVTSIAVRNLQSGQTESFSIHKIAEQTRVPFDEIDSNYDELERAMLDEYFEFVRTRQGYIWVHWNMRDINYGFIAIEHRYRALGGNPIQIEESKKFDLARELISIYGVGYAGHPRLQSIVQKNKIANRDFLSGQEEAEAFQGKEYLRLHQSTLRKVDIMANLFERAADRTLKTNSTWQEVYGVSPKVIVELINEHWITSLLILIGLLITLTSPFWGK